MNILITGASRGIGLELVKQYADIGYCVLACYRANKIPETLIEEKNKYQNIETFKVDVANIDEIKNLSKALNSKPIDILINNAAVWGPTNQELNNINIKDWLSIFQTNTIGAFLITQELLSNVLKSFRKIIVNISSNMGSMEQNTEGGTYIYRSSKAALNSITKSLAIDLKSQGVIVVSINPGWVKTDMGGPSAILNVEESVRHIIKTLDSITLKDSGTFINYDGKKLPW